MTPAQTKRWPLKPFAICNVAMDATARRALSTFVTGTCSSHQSVSSGGGKALLNAYYRRAEAMGVDIATNRSDAHRLWWASRRSLQGDAPAGHAW